MREKLREIAAAFAPKVVVSFTERPSSVGRQFVIDVGGGRTWFRKPFAGLEVRAWGNGFSVVDRFAEARDGYRVSKGTFDTVEQVAAVIRDVGAAYVAARSEHPYRRPEWVDTLVLLNTALIVLASFGLCVLIWGWSGIFYGLVAGWIGHFVSKTIGAWGVMLAVGVVYFFLR